MSSFLQKNITFQRVGSIDAWRCFLFCSLLAPEFTKNVIHYYYHHHHRQFCNVCVCMCVCLWFCFALLPSNLIIKPNNAHSINIHRKLFESMLFLFVCPQKICSSRPQSSGLIRTTIFYRDLNEIRYSIASWFMILYSKKKANRDRENKLIAVFSSCKFVVYGRSVSVIRSRDFESIFGCCQIQCSSFELFYHRKALRFVSVCPSIAAWVRGCVCVCVYWWVCVLLWMMLFLSW